MGLRPGHGIEVSTDDRRIVEFPKFVFEDPQLPVPGTDARRVSGRSKALAKQRHDLVGLRISTEHGLREHELAVQVYVEDAVCPGNHLDDADCFLPLLEDSRRQTGGVGPRPSGYAVLDPDVVAPSHRFDSSTRRLLCVGAREKRVAPIQK